MNTYKFQQFCYQFGYTPKVIRAKMMNFDAPRVVANSIPKAGTNLLIRALYLLSPMHRVLMRTVSTGDINTINNKVKKLKKGQFLAAHLKHSLELEQCIRENKVKNILMVRDPRDIAVSNYMYITYKDLTHRLHNYFNSLKSDSDRLVASIQGIESELLSGNPPSLSLAEHFYGYLPWINCSDCLIVRFEDLVGNRGGGNDEVQLKTLTKIVQHIGLSTPEIDIKALALEIFNPGSRTFVKGQIGTWKDVLEDKHMEIIKNEMNDTLIKLGYERDSHW